MQARSQNSGSFREKFPGNRHPSEGQNSESRTDRNRAWLLILAVFLAMTGLDSLQAGEPTRQEISPAASLFRLAPARQTRVAAEASGSVRDFRRRVGDYVEAGEVLAQLREERLDVELRRALGTFRGAVLNATSDAAPGDVSELALNAARSELLAISQQMSQRMILSPYSGLIRQTFAIEGELLRAGQPLLELTDTDFLQLRLPVNRRQTLTGQELCLIFGRGRLTGRVLDIRPSDTSTAPYVQLIPNLGIAVLLVPNPERILQEGELGFYPASPFGLLPEDYARSLNPQDLALTVEIKKSDELSELNTLPIELLGAIGDQRRLLIGEFFENEVAVKVVTPATAELPAQTEAIAGATLFPLANPLPTLQQFESGFPSLSEQFPQLPDQPRPGSASETGKQAVIPPPALQGILFPREYPLPLIDAKTLMAKLNLPQKSLNYVNVVRDYYLQEANRKRLSIRNPDELRSSVRNQKLSEYLSAVETLNAEFLQALRIPADSQDQKSVFRSQLQLLGTEALLIAPGPEVLQITPEQTAQLQQMQQSFVEQRQSVFESYLNPTLDTAAYQAASQRALTAWQADMPLALTAEQRSLLAEVLQEIRGTEKSPASAADQQTASSSPAAGETTSTDEDEEGPSKRMGIPDALRQQQESALTPFLYLGGGVVVVLILLGTGWFFYQRRKRG